MLFLNTLLDVIFPAKCASCGKAGADLCLKCLESAPSAERESADWIFPLYDYRNEGIKKSLWLLKYKGKRKLAKIFAEIIYEKILEELSELSVLENFVEPILVPIPLSPQRRRRRGFNQAELICQELVKIDNARGNANLRFESDILIKPRETEHQAQIKDRQKRLKNIIGSFALQDKANVKNKNTILIDDITTTGATLNEAKKILMKAGAKKVIAFTIAH